MTPGSYENHEFDPNDYGGDPDFIPQKPKRAGRGHEYPAPFSLEGVRLDKPPGFVGEVADWIDNQCRFPRRRLAVASAIVSVGNLGGLRHEDTRDGITSNMIAFCIAASATGKEAVQQAMADIHIVAGVQGALQGNMKSEQEITRNLVEHQPSYFIMDEMGLFLQKVRNAQKRGGASYLESLLAIIMSVYSKSNSHYLLSGDMSREINKIYTQQLSRAMEDDDQTRIARAERMLKMVGSGLKRPFLSIVGYSTPSTFDSIMDGETATQGFVGRSLIVVEPDINPKSKADFKKAPMPASMQGRIRQICSGGHFDVNDYRERIEHYGGMTPVDTDDGADFLLHKCAAWLHDYAEEMGQHTGEASVAMVRRSYEMIAKVSFILAIPDGVRTADHVRWAFAYVRQELDAKIKLVFANDNAKERPEDAMAARILNYLDTEKGNSLAVLANRMKAKPDVIEAVLRKMEQAGMVMERTGERRYKGKVITVWVAIPE